MSMGVLDLHVTFWMGQIRPYSCLIGLIDKLYVYLRSNSTHLSQVLPESDRSSAKCNSTHIVHVLCIWCTVVDIWRTWIVIQCFFSFWCRIPFAARIFICKTTSVYRGISSAPNSVSSNTFISHPILLGKFTFFTMFQRAHLKVKDVWGGGLTAPRRLSWTKFVTYRTPGETWAKEF